MKFLTFLAILACVAVVALAGTEKEVLVKFQPITAEEYESLLKLNSGKAVISEGRLINSAVKGLTGLATGFQMGKYLPNLFGSNGHNTKGSLGGYPLCTISSKEHVRARQLDSDSYIDMDELTEALARPGSDAKGLPVINCVLVLDDGQEEPKPPTTRRTTTRRTTTTTKKPTTTTKKPTTTTKKTTTTTKKTTTTTRKPKPTPHYPPYYPPHYPPHYPWYPSYPYPYPPSYPYPQKPPKPYYNPYTKYPVYHDNEETPDSPIRYPSINIPSFLLDKLHAIHKISPTQTTTRRPRTTRRHRPHRRSYHEYPASQYIPQRQDSNDDLDQYDDSIDYIEVSKNVHH